MTIKKSWVLDTYTNAAWTPLIAEDADVMSILLVNGGANLVSVSMRIYNKETSSQVTLILPETDIYSGEGYAFEAPLIVQKDVYELQIKCSAQGMIVTASGTI